VALRSNMPWQCPPGQATKGEGRMPAPSGRRLGRHAELGGVLARIAQGEQCASAVYLRPGGHIRQPPRGRRRLSGGDPAARLGCDRGGVVASPTRLMSSVLCEVAVAGIPSSACRFRQLSATGPPESPSGRLCQLSLELRHTVKGAGFAFCAQGYLDAKTWAGSGSSWPCRQSVCSTPWPPSNRRRRHRRR
jgi:hypothetical protein